jgi:hypothetical protein
MTHLHLIKVFISIKEIVLNLQSLRTKIYIVILKNITLKGAGGFVAEYTLNMCESLVVGWGGVSVSVCVSVSVYETAKYIIIIFSPL